MATAPTPQRPPPASGPPGGRSGTSSLKATIMDQSGAGKTRIGQLLSREGYITRNQLEEALQQQKKTNGRLGSILLRLGYIEEDTVLKVLSRLLNFTPVSIGDMTPDPDALKVLPYELAKKYMAFPLKFRGKDLAVTMAEPTDTAAVEDLQRELKCGLITRVSTEKDIVEAFRRHYKIDEKEYDSFFGKRKEEEHEEPVVGVEDFGSLVSEAAGDMEVEADSDGADGVDQYTAGDAPIVKLVNGILSKAVKDGVSDIHIEPYEKTLQVRYRIDGSLFKTMNLPLSIKNALVSRLKILSGMNIAERRVPQDGRIKMRLGRKKTIDFRVSVLPTLFGESVVMRILDQSALNVDLTKMGFEAKTFEVLRTCIARPYGLLLVTGPTGSGKTTTLYSILNRLNTEDTKILTAEDPVEFNFKGMNQVNVRDEVGMTFAAALKAFLRQDPDVIMVGEIRDLVTAEIAIKAAMTGHLVFSTLHTNDCPSTIGRLKDIGIPPYMIASAVTMVLSQRLARKLCPACKKPVNIEDFDPEELERMGFLKSEIPDLKLHGPVGCQECNGGGYRGRVGLYELMAVNDEVAKAINAAVPEDQLRKVAVHEGMTTLREAALEKARQGLLSVEEVLKRTTITKEALPAYLVNPEIEHYEDGDFIIREGNRDKDFFRLMKGSLGVVKDGSEIAQIVEPGEYFGEMAAITGEPRSASILSKGRSTVRRFPGDKLPEIIEKYPDVAKHLFETMATRLEQANRSVIRFMGEGRGGTEKMR
ncbi:MAG: type IV-A pilus assembly ATPase PilB [Deltaproteobacteria bacterium]|nr:type IV-A pilus assembly ATPase PilB [Deltaproteobacteria bacterium]